jgi:hypothetical protein
MDSAYGCPLGVHPAGSLRWRSVASDAGDPQQAVALFGPAARSEKHLDRAPSRCQGRVGPSAYGRIDVGSGQETPMNVLVIVLLSIIIPLVVLALHTAQEWLERREQRRHADD